MRAGRVALALAAVVAASVVNASDRRLGPDCSIKGKRLQGRVQIVSAFPDVKAQVVTAFPDLRVQLVSAFPDSCGKWTYVTAFPDFTIEFVQAFPDVRIEFVNAFPGRP